MMFFLFFRAISIVCLFVFAAGCSPATTNNNNNNNTDKKILVKGLFDITGPTSDVGVPYSKGVLDSIQEVNANGGIKGYKIEIEWKDYAYVPDNAVKIYSGWKGQPEWGKVVSIFGWGTGDSVILSGKAAEDKKPYVSASYAGSLASPDAVSKMVTLPDGTEYKVETKAAPYNFFAGTDYSSSIRLAMQFIKDTNGKKVLFVYCNAGYCKEPIPAGKTFAKELGLEVVGDIEVNLGDSAADADKKLKEGIEKLKLTEDDKVWVWIGNTSKTTVFIAHGVANHAPKNVKMISNVWGFDETTPERCKQDWKGTGEPCIERLHGVLPFAAFGELNYPKMKDVVVQHKKYREKDGEKPTDHANVRYVQGYVSFMIWKKAVEKLIDEKKEITGPNIKEAFETAGEISTGGLTLNLQFSKDNHRPSSGALIYAVGGDGKLAYKKEVSISLKDEWKGW